MWSDLNLRDKANLMKLFIRNGITDISQMAEYYNASTKDEKNAYSDFSLKSANIGAYGMSLGVPPQMLIQKQKELDHKETEAIRNKQWNKLDKWHRIQDIYDIQKWAAQNAINTEPDNLGYMGEKYTIVYGDAKDAKQNNRINWQTGFNSTPTFSKFKKYSNSKLYERADGTATWSLPAGSKYWQAGSRWLDKNGSESSAGGYTSRIMADIFRNTKESYTNPELKAFMDERRAQRNRQNTSLQSTNLQNTTSQTIVNPQVNASSPINTTMQNTIKTPTTTAQPLQYSYHPLKMYAVPEIDNEGNKWLREGSNTVTRIAPDGSTKKYSYNNGYYRYADGGKLRNGNWYGNIYDYTGDLNQNYTGNGAYTSREFLKNRGFIYDYRNDSYTNEPGKVRELTLMPDAYNNYGSLARLALGASMFPVAAIGSEVAPLFTNLGKSLSTTARTVVTPENVARFMIGDTGAKVVDNITGGWSDKVGQVLFPNRDLSATEKTILDLTNPGWLASESPRAITGTVKAMSKAFPRYKLVDNLGTSARYSIVDSGNPTSSEVSTYKQKISDIDTKNFPKQYIATAKERALNYFDDLKANRLHEILNNKEIPISLTEDDVNGYTNYILNRYKRLGTQFPVGYQTPKVNIGGKEREALGISYRDITDQNSAIGINPYPGVYPIEQTLDHESSHLSTGNYTTSDQIPTYIKTHLPNYDGLSKVLDYNDELFQSSLRSGQDMYNSQVFKDGNPKEIPDYLTYLEDNSEIRARLYSMYNLIKDYGYNPAEFLDAIKADEYGNLDNAIFEADPALSDLKQLNYIFKKDDLKKLFKYFLSAGIPAKIGSSNNKNDKKTI